MFLLDQTSLESHEKHMLSPEGSGLWVYLHTGQLEGRKEGERREGGRREGGSGLGRDSGGGWGNSKPSASVSEEGRRRAASATTHVESSQRVRQCVWKE